MKLRRHISRISVKNISLPFIFIIIIIAIIINIISIINLVVITDNLANNFFTIEIKKKTEDFFAASTESSQAANGEKTEYILNSCEEERRQNSKVRVLLHYCTITVLLLND